MNRLILPIGISGSGKSTWIKSLEGTFVIISPDEMRVEFTGDMDNKSMDVQIYEEVKLRTVRAINNGFDVILDSTNLQRNRRRDFISYVTEHCSLVNIYYKLLVCDGNLSKQRIKSQIDKGESRANVSDSTIDRHVSLYQNMLEDIKQELFLTI